MRTSLVCPALWVLWLASPSAGGDRFHALQTPKYFIDMTVKFPPPYLGTRLSLFDSHSGREICLAVDGSFGRCIERFVGALAVVTYSVRHRKGNTPASGELREHVVVIAQSAELPQRPPFEKTQRLVNGCASDIQLFGYAGDPPATPDQDAGIFRCYRQSLYLNGDAKPFAVIDWRHTLQRITMLRVEAQ